MPVSMSARNMASHTLTKVYTILEVFTDEDAALNSFGGESKANGSA